MQNFLTKVFIAGSLAFAVHQTLEAAKLTILAPKGQTIINREPEILGWGNIKLRGNFEILNGKLILEETLSGVVCNANILIRGSLSGSKMQNFISENGDYEGVDFGDADLRNARFNYCDFSGANLEDATVEGTHFKWCAGLSKEQLADLQQRGAILEKYETFGR